MSCAKSLITGIFILSIFGCSEDTIVAPNEQDIPEKLFPYEVIYDSATFKQRRDDLINQLSDDAITIITTNDTYLRNGDVDYEFRPTSCFFYLTGFDEPNAVAIITKSYPGSETSELIMFVEEYDDIETQWLGPVYGPEGAIAFFGADLAYPIERFPSLINSYLNIGLYQSIYANFEANLSVAESFYESVSNPPDIYDINDIVDIMRTKKSPIEFNSIQRAVDVSVQSFSEAMIAIKPGMFEYEVEAIYDYILALNGCPSTAFPTIVASGPNINILHYQANDRQMQDGDLVMIDFGAEYGYYAADITRTLPVNGKFSKSQADVYEIVLEAHKTAINAAAPGVSFYDLYFLARDIVLDGLLEKNIISGDKSKIISSYRYRQYIPAGLGHCVGLDVHDPFPREENGDRILKENMILAFEPHIYLYENDYTVDPQYWNTSARIEDVILITSAGSEILSKELPIEIADIEALMR